MSYGPSGHAASKYQEMEVLAANPGQLVVIVYDHLLVCLRRAELAIERGDVEQRVVQLDKVRDAVGELLATLDFEKGGEIAKQLSGLYAFFLSELIEVARRNDAARLARISGMVRELRDAFAEIAGSGRAAPAA